MSDLPTEPGHYWWRNIEEEKGWRIVEVIKQPGGRLGASNANLSHSIGEWKKIEEPGANDAYSLCSRMLILGATAKGTGNMKASEIKALLLPFFGQAEIDRSVKLITG